MISAGAWNRPCYEVNGFTCSCSGGPCTGKVSMLTQHRMFLSVWNTPGQDLCEMISQTDRKAHLKRYLKTCFSLASKTFTFYGDTHLVNELHNYHMA